MDRNLRKTRIGVVTSDKMDKTVVVAVETSVRHKVYNKIVKRTYHLIYNLEALKEGSVFLSDLALERVKKWHRGNVSLEDLSALKDEIMAL